MQRLPAGDIMVPMTARTRKAQDAEDQHDHDLQRSQSDQSPQIQEAASKRRKPARRTAKGAAKAAKGTAKSAVKTTNKTAAKREMKGPNPAKGAKSKAKAAQATNADKRESKKTRYLRMHKEYAILCQVYPTPKSALNFSNPFELLIATMMSAQTTDVQVNKVTPELFRRFPTPLALSQANPSEVAEIINSIGFFRTKAQHAVMIANDLITRFGSEVPRTMEELTTLPGVGRKTANVILGNAFDLPGFPVDTHVMRVTKRLHWRSDWNKTKDDPVAIEKEVTAAFEPTEWRDLSHRLIDFGRDTCHARKPECLICPLRDTCPSFGLYI